MKTAAIAVVIALCLLAFGLPALGQAGSARSGAPPEWPQPVLDSEVHSFFLIDQLEYRSGDGANAMIWDALSWIGGDYNRLWLETEGRIATDGDTGEIERFDVLYGRLIAPFWDLQAGVRYQRNWGPGPDPDRVFAVIGLQGLAPYNFEIDSNILISENGDVSADLQATYDLLITQRLVFQPRFETAVAVREVQEFGVGEGFNLVSLGARLRYEIRRELAPYVGLTWVRKLGQTADFAKAEGQDIDNLAILVGLRFWF